MRKHKKKINKNNKKTKAVEINLSALIIISAIISIIFILFLGHQISTVGTKVVINLVEETVDEDDIWKITVVNESGENTGETVTTASNTDISDYKATDDLTDEDKEDEYQKNYQETTDDNDNYLIKTAEWTDKENGEALITIEGSLTVEQETTALYVTTICYAHGLTKDIILKNIQYLAENYDYVDFIIVASNSDNDYCICDAVTYTSESTEDEILEYISEVFNYYPYGGQHFTYTIIPALEYYLFGGLGDSYIFEDNMRNDPLAIYVSFDGFYNSDYVRRRNGCFNK